MKNKIKKLGALFMALMLLVSGFGNLGTVFAEDVPQETDWATDPETARDDQYVKFEDDRLESYLKSILFKNTDSNNRPRHISVKDMRSLNNLFIMHDSVADANTIINPEDKPLNLGGLEFASNLEALFIGIGTKNNDKIRNLKQLNQLTVYNNMISIKKRSYDVTTINQLDYLLDGETLFDIDILNDLPKLKSATFHNSNVLKNKNMSSVHNKSIKNLSIRNDFCDKLDISHMNLESLSIYNTNIKEILGLNNKIKGTIIEVSEPGIDFYDRKYDFLRNNGLSAGVAIIKVRTINGKFKLPSYIENSLANKIKNAYSLPKLHKNEDIQWNDIFNILRRGMIYNKNDDTFYTLNKTLLTKIISENKFILSSLDQVNETIEDAIDSVLQQMQIDKRTILSYSFIKSHMMEYDLNNITPSMINDSSNGIYGSYYILSIEPKILPEGKDITAKAGDKPDAKDAIANNGDLPEDTNYKWEEDPDTTKPGKKPAVVVVTYPDGSNEKTNVTVNVVIDAGTITPVPEVKVEKETVKWGGTYDLTDNIINLPEGAKVKDVTPENTINVRKSGDYTGKVEVTFKDGAKRIVSVPVTVLPSQAETNTPNGKDLTVKVGEEPKAEDAITNKEKLPDGTKYEWKEKPDTKEVGEKDSVVIVTYPDGSKDEVIVKVSVIDPKTDAEKYPANKPTKTEVEDKNNLTPDEKTKVEEEVKKVNPEAKDIEVKDNGDVVITYPDGSTNNLPQEDTVCEKEKENIPLTPLTPAGEDIPLTPLTPAEEIEKPVEPKKDYSREPKVDPIYEGDEKITGKGEPRSDIEVRLPNRKTAYGRTDRDGYFEIKIGIKLYEDEKIYVTQIEDGKEPSKEVVETIKRSYRHKYDKNNTTKTTSTSDVVGVLNTVQDKLITKDHYSYIVGYPDGGFKPANTITRAEVATIFARLSKDQSVSSNVTFKDVNANDWFNKAVKIGVSQGFINGFGDGTFKPNKPITRAEFASVISTYANKSKANNTFGDVDGWAAGAIDTAYVNGWMQGNAGKFRPNDPLTRAEAVTVINRMLNRQADKAFIVNAINNHIARAYNDINANEWFFYDVYAASWGHNYTIENGVEKWTGLNGKAFTIR